MKMKENIIILVWCLSFLMGLNIIPSTFSDSNVQVGIYYYLWYDPNDPTSWEYPKIRDKPVLGYYNSCDTSVIEQHLKWMSDAHIDFAIICWYGYTSYTFINEATHQVFEVAKNISSNVKLAIAVEPYNETENGYDYEGIYNYVWNEFVEPYKSFYYYYQGKPLLLFYQGKYLTQNGNFPKNNTYTIEVFGHMEYCDWVYGYGGDLNVYGIYPRNRQFSVMPRYDETSIPNRPRQHYVDPKLEYLYKEQWEEALDSASHNEIDIITITSWNEFPERTAIEPHYDSTAWNNDPFYLYNLTRNYICELKGIDPQTYINWYDNPKKYVIICGVIIVVALVVKWGFKKF